MRLSAMLSVVAALALYGCATGYTPQQDNGLGYSDSSGSGPDGGYNSDYQGGELSRSPLDRNSEMLQ